MDRRDFLKSIGLGGMALTLPKPLSVVAATMRDLTDPPIHMGLARFRGLGGLLIHDFSLSYIDPNVSRERHSDLVENWSIHLVAHDGGGGFVPILQGSVLGYIVGKPNIGALIDRGALPARLLAQTFLDIWIVPHSRPTRSLPELTATLHGTGTGPAIQTGWGPLADITAQIRTVRLERTRAIELGLVSPSDPFEAV